MVNIFSSIRRLFKRRQHQRYVVKEGTFVIVSPSDSKKGQGQKVQLIDISQGGMAFIYQGSLSELEKSGILKLLADTPSGVDINFDTVSDTPASDITPLSDPFQRRGVKFKWLGYLEKPKLKNFIDQVQICEKD